MADKLVTIAVRRKYGQVDGASADNTFETHWRNAISRSPDTGEIPAKGIRIFSS